MFVGREWELKAFEEKYASPTSEFFIVFGRRRIGKTELVKQFTSNKKHVYFVAREQKKELEIERFVDRIGVELGITILDKRDFETVFRELTSKLDTKEKTVIVIDEFTLWVKRDAGILSEFQVIWDEALKDKNIFLILTGSAVSIMENDVLGVKSPLYGRRTGQIKVEQLPISTLNAFLPSYSFEDIIKTYGVTGGVPYYLQEFKDNRTFEENLLQTVFNKSNPLSIEAELLLREELREIHTYFAILQAVLEGATSTSEIASKSKVDATNLNKYLRVLMELGLVKKEYPATEPPKARSALYTIEDNYIRFWLKYFYHNEDAVEENPTSVVQALVVNYPSYIGRYVFEQLCKKAFRRLSNFNYSQIGRWWLKDKEIDLVAINEKTSEIFFAECKWQTQRISRLDMEKLIEKTKQVQWRQIKRTEHFGFFSKSGFDESAIEFAKTNKIHIWNLNEVEKALNYQVKQ